MSTYEVNTTELAAATKQVKKVSADLQNASQRLKNVRITLLLQSGAGIDSARSAISSMSTAVTRLSGTVLKQGNFLGEVEKKALSYEKTAKRLLEGANPEKKDSLWKIITDSIGNIAGWLKDNIGLVISAGLNPTGAWLKYWLEKVKDKLPNVGTGATLAGLGLWGGFIGGILGEWEKVTQPNDTADNQTGDTVVDKKLYPSGTGKPSCVTYANRRLKEKLGIETVPSPPWGGVKGGKLAVDKIADWLNNDGNNGIITAQDGSKYQVSLVYNELKANSFYSCESSSAPNYGHIIFIEEVRQEVNPETGELHDVVYYTESVGGDNRVFGVLKSKSVEDFKSSLKCHFEDPPNDRDPVPDPPIEIQSIHFEKISVPPLNPS